MEDSNDISTEANNLNQRNNDVKMKEENASENNNLIDISENKDEKLLNIKKNRDKIKDEKKWLINNIKAINSTNRNESFSEIQNNFINNLDINQENLDIFQSLYKSSKNSDNASLTFSEYLKNNVAPLDYELFTKSLNAYTLSQNFFPKKDIIMSNIFTGFDSIISENNLDIFSTNDILGNMVWYIFYNSYNNDYPILKSFVNNNVELNEGTSKINQENCVYIDYLNICFSISNINLDINIEKGDNLQISKVCSLFDYNEKFYCPSFYFTNNFADKKVLALIRFLYEGNIQFGIILSIDNALIPLSFNKGLDINNGNITKFPAINKRILTNSKKNNTNKDFPYSLDNGNIEIRKSNKEKDYFDEFKYSYSMKTKNGIQTDWLTKCTKSCKRKTCYQIELSTTEFVNNTIMKLNSNPTEWIFPTIFNTEWYFNIQTMTKLPLMLCLLSTNEKGLLSTETINEKVNEFDTLFSSKQYFSLFNQSYSLLVKLCNKFSKDKKKNFKTIRKGFIIAFKVLKFLQFIPQIKEYNKVKLKWIELCKLFKNQGISNYLSLNESKLYDFINLQYILYTPEFWSKEENEQLYIENKKCLKSLGSLLEFNQKVNNITNIENDITNISSKLKDQEDDIFIYPDDSNIDIDNRIIINLIEDIKAYAETEKDSIKSLEESIKNGNNTLKQDGLKDDYKNKISEDINRDNIIHKEKKDKLYDFMIDVTYLTSIKNSKKIKERDVLNTWRSQKSKLLLENRLRSENNEEIINNKHISTKLKKQQHRYNLRSIKKK